MLLSFDHRRQFGALSFLLVLSSLTLIGCGVGRKAIAPVSSAIAVAGDEDGPYKLALLNERNDGNNLTVSASVSPNTPDSTVLAVVRLKGLKDGSVIHSAVEQVSIPDDGSSSEASAAIQDLSLTIPSAGLSEYQLELLWGEDATQALASLDRELKLNSPLILRNLEVESSIAGCQTPPCPHELILNGELFNNGSSALSEVVLGVSFEWIKKGLQPGNEPPLQGQAGESGSDIVKGEEQQVSVSGINLGPGESRKVRLLFDQLVPQQGLGRYKPVLRIVSFG